MSRTNYAKKDGTIRLGDRLRQLRKLKELTLREVAAKVDMDQTILSKCEMGQRTPSEEHTKHLARFFGVDEKEMQSQRIAEKFRQENEGDPCAVGAVYILAEEA